MGLSRFCAALIIIGLTIGWAHAQDGQGPAVGPVPSQGGNSSGGPRVSIDTGALLGILIDELSRPRRQQPSPRAVPVPRSAPIPQRQPQAPAPSRAGNQSAPRRQAIKDTAPPPKSTARDYGILAKFDPLPAVEDLSVPASGRYLLRLDAEALGLDEAALERIGAAEIVGILAPAVQIEAWQVRHIYRRVYFGAAIELTEPQSDQLSANIGLISNAQLGLDTPVAPAEVIRTPWALDRIDQTALPLNGEFVAPRSHPMARVYVLDTGIRADHEQLTGRVSGAIRFVASVQTFRSADDDTAQIILDLCARHGTAMASLIAGDSIGVTKAARVIDVTVLPCPPRPGAASDVIAGLDWVLGQEQNAAIPGHAVVNLSLSGPFSPELNDASSALVQAGIPVIAASGNIASARDNNDSCTRSPASAAGVISVAASDSQDNVASFSVLGDCVDLIAPGEEVLTASSRATDSYARTNGTSEATAIVAALIAARGVAPIAQESLAEVERLWIKPLTERAGRVMVPELHLASTQSAPSVPLSLVRAGDAPADCKVATLGSPLNLRKSPAESSDIITALQNHADLWLIDTEAAWVKVVSLGGELGWVARRYTKAVREAGQKVFECGSTSVKANIQ